MLKVTDNLHPNRKKGIENASIEINFLKNKPKKKIEQNVEIFSEFELNASDCWILSNILPEKKKQNSFKTLQILRSIIVFISVLHVQS